MLTFSRTKNNFSNIIQNKNVLLLICLFVIVLYFLPYLFLGKNFPLTIHDNLDSNVVWAKLFLENDHVFSLQNIKVAQLMNGLPQTSVCSSYDFSLVFFNFFGMYWGFVVNKIIMALIGFFGMYLLLANHFLCEKKFILITYSVALIFAILPYWSFSLSVSGLPLLLYAFMNIRKGNVRYYNWLIIILMSFYSSLIFSGFFFLFVVGLVFIYDTATSKKINKAYLLAIIGLGAGYILSHISLFYSFLNKSDGDTHRVEFKKESMSFLDAFKNSENIFLNGQYHSHSLHLFILPSVIICLFLIWKNRQAYKTYLLIIVFILLTSLFYGFLNWKGVSSFFYMLSKIVPVQLQRFHTLHPMFWYILFAISLSVILIKLRFGKYLVTVLIFLQFGFVVKNHEFFKNKYQPSFKNFYAENICNDIKNYIAKDQSTYRVMSLGIHPAVSQYNGFYTLDGYVANYPLYYKHEFREVIKGELTKDSILKSYFDNWGSRCYAFSSELGKNFMFSKQAAKKVEYLNFDLEAFKKMGGQYILSAVEINQVNNPKYILQKTFESKESFWKIYLYKIL